MIILKAQPGTPHVVYTDRRANADNHVIQFQFQFNLLSTNKTICSRKQQQKPE